MQYSFDDTDFTIICRHANIINWNCLSPPAISSTRGKLSPSLLRFSPPKIYLIDLDINHLYVISNK